MPGRTKARMEERLGRLPEDLVSLVQSFRIEAYQAAVCCATCSAVVLYHVRANQLCMYRNYFCLKGAYVCDACARRADGSLLCAAPETLR
jgi:hypothetical protein